MTASRNDAPGRPLAAVVDLGTNAARLAMASLGSGGELVSEGRWRELIRLGEGVGASRRLSPEAMDRAEECLGRFAAIVEERGVDAFDALATSALREAENAAEFLGRAEAAGVSLRVISAEEEARLALSGALAGLGDAPSDAWLFDVGGGSVELIRASGAVVGEMASIPAGVVYLTERYLKEMPTPEAQVEACAQHVRAALDEALSAPAASDDLPLVGCGGTVALAWFIGEGRRGLGGINGVEIERGAFASWVERFSGLTFDERRALPGFEPGREDVALAGLILVSEILGWSGKSRVIVATGGVREGRLLELLRDDR